MSTTNLVLKIIIYDFATRVLPSFNTFCGTINRESYFISSTFGDNKLFSYLPTYLESYKTRLENCLSFTPKLYFFVDRLSCALLALFKKVVIYTFFFVKRQHSFYIVVGHNSSYSISWPKKKTEEVTQ